MVFIPRKGNERPAMIVELKFNGSAEGAIAQVRERGYPQLVQEFADRLQLVGVNYDRKSKRHECRIERWGAGQKTDQKEVLIWPDEWPETKRKVASAIASNPNVTISILEE